MDDLDREVPVEANSDDSPRSPSTHHVRMAKLEKIVTKLAMECTQTSCVLDWPGMEPLGGCGQGQEAGPVKEPELAHIKEEPETWDCQYEDLVKEEAWCMDELGQEALSSETAGSCGVSSAAMLAGLYADHTVKDELVLGPELPHRPTVTPVFRTVRLERLRAPHKPARRASAPHTYACDMCTQRFNSKSVLIGHIATHYRCEVCDKTFMMSDCLTRHARNCTENKQKERKLANKNALSKSHGEVVLYYCDGCGRGYKCKIFLSKHIQRSHKVRQVLHNSHSRLFKHQVRLTEMKPFHCSQCVFKSSKKSLLQRHQMIHTGEKPFKCDYCDFKCNRKEILQTHQRTHTGEKPFKCGYCDFKCNRKEILQTHQRIHTAEKPFKCGYCDYKCSNKSNLRRHQRIHTGEKPFKCRICDYKCRLKEQLQTHQRIHSGEKPFKCGYCNHKCSQKSSLQTHLRIHTGEKPFKCGYCDYKCSHKSSLQTHQRTHTGEKPFKCGYCDYISTTKTNLRRHEMVHRRAAVSL